MRISTSQLHTRALNQMLDLQRQAADTQEQIASGRRYATAADDPVGAVRVERLNGELAQRAQYQKNIDLAESELSLEEASLEQAGNLLQRIRELTVQAGNPIHTREDRNFIAAEIETRFDELMQLMNTRLASGDYLFGGNAGGQPPFVQDADGSVRYQGDEGQRAVKIDGAISIPVNDSGKRLFVDVAAASVTARASAHPGNSSDGTAAVSVEVVDQAALEALHPGALVIEFEPLSEAGGLPNFTVRRQSDQRVVDGLENVVYTPGDIVTVGGMELELQGNPEVGDRFVVSTSNRQDVLTTVARLADGLRSAPAVGQDDEAYQAMIADTLTNLDNAMSTVLEVRSEIGARMGVLDSVRGLHDQVTVLSTELKSEIEDVDFAKAISDLSQQTLVLQAAQQSFLRVSRLSLFDAI